MHAKKYSRRQFIDKSLKTGMATAILSPMAINGLAGCQSPAVKGIAIGLSHYSLRFLFRDNELDLPSYPAFAKETFGITEIDVWEGGIPTEKLDDDAFYRQVRENADQEGSNIFLFMTGVVDARGESAGERKSQASEFFPSADRAAMLGSQYLRVFLRAPQIAENEAAKWSAETLQPLADYVQKKNMKIAIEPGASPHTQKGTFLVQVMEELQHPACTLMPDFGKFSGDPYQGTRVMMPYTEVVSAKSHNFDDEGNEKEFDYYRLMKIVVDSGFKGIIAIEYEGKETPPVQGVQATKDLIEKALRKA